MAPTPYTKPRIFSDGRYARTRPRRSTVVESDVGVPRFGYHPSAPSEAPAPHGTLDNNSFEAAAARAASIEKEESYD